MARKNTNAVAQRRSKANQVKGNRTRAAGMGTPFATVYSTVVTGSTGAGSFPSLYQISPHGLMASQPTISIANSYQWYKIVSAEAEWIPTTGLDVGGYVDCAYVTSSQASFNATIDLDMRQPVLESEQNRTVHQANIGFVKRLDVSRFVEKRWFVSSNTFNTYAEYALESSGCFIARISGAPSGRWIFRVRFQFRDLGIQGDVVALASKGQAGLDRTHCRMEDQICIPGKGPQPFPGPRRPEPEPKPEPEPEPKPTPPREPGPEPKPAPKPDPEPTEPEKGSVVMKLSDYC